MLDYWRLKHPHYEFIVAFSAETLEFCGNVPQIHDKNWLKYRKIFFDLKNNKNHDIIIKSYYRVARVAAGAQVTEHQIGQISEILTQFEVFFQYNYQNNQLH